MSEVELMPETETDYTITVSKDEVSAGFQIEPPLSVEHKELLTQNAATRRTIKHLHRLVLRDGSVDRYSVLTLNAGSSASDPEHRPAGDLDASYSVMQGKAEIIKSVLVGAGLKIDLVFKDNRARKVIK